MNIYTETYENIYKFLHSDQLHEDTARSTVELLVKSAWVLQRNRRDAKVVQAIARAVARGSTILLTAKQLWDVYNIIRSNKKQEQILAENDLDSIQVPLQAHGGKKIGTTRRSHRTTRPMKDK